MKKTKKALTLAVAAVMMCGAFAGCDLVTKDSKKDYLQVIAKVDITNSPDFAAGGIFSEYKDVITPTEITKREMVVSYVNSGYSIQNSYGWSYSDTFDYISKSLVNREIDIQYSMAYFLKNGVEGATVEGYKAAVAAEPSNELAGLEYFLNDKEIKIALYTSRLMLNNTIDSREDDYIQTTGDSSSSTVTARTTPEGLNTENEDYYDETYRIYTGLNSLSECGSYEKKEGSTRTTRKKAYESFLAYLGLNDLLEDNEDTTDVEGLSYFTTVLKSYYESAIINKLADCFEQEAAEKLTEEDMTKYYNAIYNGQVAGFNANRSSFESALDSISDSDFLLTAPEENYGYVINILLPFSTSQSAALSGLSADYNDAKGNYYVQRTALLQNLLATDQRGTWFTGDEDYSFVGEGYTGGNDARDRLFFEEALNADENSKYEPLKNYYGKYTYNGSVYYNEDTEKYVLSPNKITIDDFLGEMEGYLQSTGLTLDTNAKRDYSASYYDVADYNYYYKEDGSVDYEKFLYYVGKVNLEHYDPNDLFVAGTDVNKAMSVMKELSFAYNTDTAGLNSYLGYSVVVGKTSFVGEFEYAAQLVCEMGAGAYAVVPSTYGWHIIYCTFSFKAGVDGETIQPFTYNHEDALNKEGSFSNLFYESMKSSIVSSYSTNRQTNIINNYLSGATIYEERYSDLKALDDNA